MDELCPKCGNIIDNTGGTCFVCMPNGDPALVAPDQAATIARLTAELDAMTDERDQMFAKAVVDPGSNHIVGWKQVAEEAQAYNVRLEAERDKFKALHEQENNRANEFYAQAFKANAHNATMQRALDAALSWMGRKDQDDDTEPPIPQILDAVVPDAGKPILKVVTTGIEWWRTGIAFAIDPEVTEDDVGLAERRHMDAISALNASREIGLTQAAPLPGGSAQEPPAS